MNIAMLELEDAESGLPHPASGNPALTVAARRLAVRLLALAFFITCWQFASTQKSWLIVNFANIPSPVEVAAAAGDYLRSPTIARDVESSLRRIFIGFGIATLLAIPLGILIGRSRWAEDTLLVPFEILRPIPAVAWIPLAILMFHTAEQSMIYICFLGAFYPILLSTIHGVESLDKRLVFASESLGAGPWTIFCEVVFLGALPSIVTGLSIGMGTAWFSLVTAEMVAGQYGIGYFTWESYTLQNYSSIVVGMLLIGILGMASSAMIRIVGNLLMPWKRYATHPAQ